MSGGDDCVIAYGIDGRQNGMMIHWNCDDHPDGTVTRIGADEALAWVDRTVTRTRFSLWRTRAGFHYEDRYPHDGGDEEVSYRFDTAISGVLYGAYPELGEVRSSSFEPETTKVDLPVKRGGWVPVQRPAENT